MIDRSSVIDSRVDNIQVGDILSFYYGPNLLTNRIVEVRAIVDTDYLIVRCWSGRKSRYIYDIIDKIFVSLTLKGMKQSGDSEELTVTRKGMKVDLLRCTG